MTAERALELFDRCRDRLLLRSDEQENRELSEARAFFAAMVERTTWRPIETAPKDGTRIMLAVICRNKAQQGKEPEFYILASWCYDHWSPFVPNEWTHWIPLPTGPEPQP